MPRYEVTVKYTRRINATDEEQVKDAIETTQKWLMSNVSYEIIEIKEVE